jgi:hypothetical protein
LSCNVYNFFAHQFQSGDMRTVAAEGLCKLLLNDRIKSSNLVSRLLIMWYNPVTGIVPLNVLQVRYICLEKTVVRKYVSCSKVSETKQTDFEMGS